MTDIRTEVAPSTEEQQDVMKQVGIAGRSRRYVGLIVALGVLALLIVVSIAVGSKNIPLATVIDALLHSSGEGDAYVIWSMRIPRTVVGIVVGIGLGISGALIQALTRNPLADPGILGVNAGAAFFVALGIALFGVTSTSGYAWFAFVGALVVTVAVYLIGSAGRGGADPVQLTLAGVALAAVLQGIITGMVLLNPRAFDQMRSWNAGSLGGRGWDVLLPVVPSVIIGVLVAFIAAGALNAISLGDDLARSLGVNISVVRVAVIFAVTLLAGGATAIAGPIGFVGLMVPHIARWVTGPDQRWIIVYTLVLSPAFMLAADVLGRIVIRPGEFPVGLVTAFVGAPVLILMVRRKKAAGL